jgi:uncharacterized protein (TIGR03435 family)
MSTGEKWLSGPHFANPTLAAAYLEKVALMKAPILALFFTGYAFSQTPAAPLTFEVADVKISKPGTNPNADFLPGGKLVLQYLTMKEMIVAAWNYDRWPDRISGGPDWLDSEHYDIVAKALQTTPEADLRLMLRNLLIERFKLQTHVEQKPVSVYALVVGRKGKLKESAGEGDKNSCKVQTPAERKDGQIIRSFMCTQTSMDFLAERLPNVAPGYIELPVVNMTDLKGRYDFTIGWTPRRRTTAIGGGDTGKAPEIPTTGESDGFTIFDSLQSQMGLKLEQRKHPMEVVVIDKVQRQPVE